MARYPSPPRKTLSYRVLLRVGSPAHLMNKTIVATLVAAGQLLLTQSAQAVTFNFSWQSDAPGLTLFEGGPAHIATGTLDINVGPGEPFTVGNVSNVNITLTDGTHTLNLDDSYLQSFSGTTNENLTRANKTFLSCIMFTFKSIIVVFLSF